MKTQVTKVNLFGITNITLQNMTKKAPSEGFYKTLRLSVKGSLQGVLKKFFNSGL